MKQTTYTATDIERYHSGQLSFADRHAIEKAALDDPFLADALEGFAITKTSANDIKGLKRKLKLRIEKDGDQKIFTLSRNWLKIAALFIIMAGTAWLVIDSLSPKAETIAQKNNVDNGAAETLTYKVPTAAVAPDSLTTNSVTASSKPSVDDAGSNSDKKIATPNSLAGEALQDREATNLSVLHKDVTALNVEETKTSSVFSADNQLFDSVKKQNEQALAFKSKAGRIADTINNVNIVLQRRESAPYDVVVINKNKQAPKSRSQVIAESVKIDTLQPAEGWSNFDDYIASHIKTPDELEIKPVSGEVELSFDINKEGVPVNIAVTKSLCEKCDAEAIRLLKEGPKWRNKKRSGRIKIKF